MARRTWVLPNAVDAGFFDVQAAPDADAAPIILCVGAVCLRKNQNAFIRALDPLAEQKEFKVIFLGQTDAGAYGAEFLQLVKARAWCEHAGFAGRERMKEFFQAATALVLPSTASAAEQINALLEDIDPVIRRRIEVAAEDVVLAHE